MTIILEGNKEQRNWDGHDVVYELNIGRCTVTRCEKDVIACYQEIGWYIDNGLNDRDVREIYCAAYTMDKKKRNKDMVSINRCTGKMTHKIAAI
jgi:hypothetical protein